jgi:pimeloyl-ACP methyl ester carboxylesterase
MRRKDTSPVGRLIALALVAALWAAPVRASGFSELGKPRDFARAPGVHDADFVAIRGPSPFDRIGLHHLYLGAAAPHHPEITVLYLPGTNMNGEIAPDESRYSFPLYLAAHGIDVWTMDYRTHFIAPDTPMAALSELRGWTCELFVSDIAAASDFIRRETGHRKLFLAGFSRGVEFGYLFAAMYPERVEGLIALDGFIPRRPSRPAPHRYADDLGGRHLTWEKREALIERVIHNPDGPAPIAKFKTARENLEHVLYYSAGFGGHGGLANPMGGFSKVGVLARVLATYDRYWPAVQDTENPFAPARLSRLGASHIPVIAFSSSNIAPGWPAMVAESAHSTGSRDVTVTNFPGWGHLDVLCGTEAEAKVYAPVLGWLRRHRKAAATSDAAAKNRAVRAGGSG